MSRFIDRPRYVCSLGGGLETLHALPRTVPIVHASSGCGANISNATNPGGGHFGSGYVSGTALPSTNVIERDIVFGGEDRLKEQIKSTLEIVDGDLYVVVTGCMVEMIGDDVKRVTREFSDDGHPILVAETGGFRGNSFTGYDLILETLFREFVLKKEEKKEDVVNIFGVVPAQDAFYKGNLRELKTLLSKLGLKVNTIFGEGETLEDLKNIGDAKLNIVVSDFYGVDPAKVFEEVHGTPYIVTSIPIGARASEEFVSLVAESLGLEDKLTEKVIKEEKGIYYDYLERIVDIVNDVDLQRYGIVVGDANYGPAVTKFISDELGWIPSLTVITDILEDEQKEKLLERFEDYESGLKPTVVFDTDTSSVKRHLKKVWPQNNGSKYFDSFGPAVIIGSSFERDLSEEFGYPLLNVSFPVTSRVSLSRAYAGFRGGINLVEDLITLLVSGR
ncbi:nitrogenase component 1 [Clostridium sp. YIM B02506]|uniref:nitrogenase component 1 n=1 Tax=Clostridium sp. YIM B02506 TaxID=2910680 RepID=UPI001EEE9891|nr:nitrogenase component 1 [Clostridium sp. YIM B02506]